MQTHKLQHLLVCAGQLECEGVASSLILLQSEHFKRISNIDRAFPFTLMYYVAQLHLLCCALLESRRVCFRETICFSLRHLFKPGIFDVVSQEKKKALRASSFLTL